MVTAGAAEARLLGVARGAPLVSISRTAWSATGFAFERSHDLFRADRVRIVVGAPARRRGVAGVGRDVGAGDATP